MFLAGLSFGVSCFLSGYFDLSVWGALALVWLAVLLALALARPALLLWPAGLAVGGLLALSVWALISTGWAESSGQALEESARWLFYAVVLASLLLLLRGRRLEPLLLAGAIAPVLVTGRLPPDQARVRRRGLALPQQPPARAGGLHERDGRDS